MILIAHNIRSLYNVGSIFRNAAAFGVEKLYLTGYTGVPPRKEISKVALGAQDLVVWEQGEVGKVIEELKATGYAIYGLETGGEDIAAFQAPEKLALILGSEVEGIEKEVVDQLDGMIEIPMSAKRSLNVSVASGVAIYQLNHGKMAS